MAIVMSSIFCGTKQQVGRKDIADRGETVEADKVPVGGAGSARRDDGSVGSPFAKRRRDSSANLGRDMIGPAKF